MAPCKRICCVRSKSGPTLQPLELRLETEVRVSLDEDLYDDPAFVMPGSDGLQKPRRPQTYREASQLGSIAPLLCERLVHLFSYNTSPPNSDTKLSSPRPAGRAAFVEAALPMLALIPAQLGMTGTGSVTGCTGLHARSCPATMQERPVSVLEVEVAGPSHEAHVRYDSGRPTPSDQGTSLSSPRCLESDAENAGDAASGAIRTMRRGRTARGISEIYTVLELEQSGGEGTEAARSLDDRIGSNWDGEGEAPLTGPGLDWTMATQVGPVVGKEAAGSADGPVPPSSSSSAAQADPSAFSYNSSSSVSLLNTATSTPSASPTRALPTPAASPVLPERRASEPTSPIRTRQSRIHSQLQTSSRTTSTLGTSILKANSKLMQYGLRQASGNAGSGGRSVAGNKVSTVFANVDPNSFGEPLSRHRPSLASLASEESSRCNSDGPTLPKPASAANASRVTDTVSSIESIVSQTAAAPAPIAVASGPYRRQPLRRPTLTSPKPDGFSEQEASPGLPRTGSAWYDVLAGKKHHPYPREAAPYWLSFEHEVLVLCVAELFSCYL